MGVHQTLRYLGGGSGFTKNQYIGGIDKKEGAWTICRFKRGLGKNLGVMFLRGWFGTPIHTMGKLREWEVLRNGGDLSNGGLIPPLRTILHSSLFLLNPMYYQNEI